MGVIVSCGVRGRVKHARREVWFWRAPSWKRCMSGGSMELGGKGLWCIDVVMGGTRDRGRGGD